MTSSEDNGSLIVPIANPETVDRLLETAIDIARERSKPIVVVHVVEVPPQVPLSEGEQIMSDEDAQMLEYAAEKIRDADVTLETKLRFARDTATGIVGSVDAYDGDALLMGWHGRPRRRDIVLGSFLDRVLGEASCDVYVQRIKYPRETPESILVPVAGGPHDELGADLAGVIASQHDARVTLLHVEHPNRSDSSHDEHVTLLRNRRERIPNGVTVDERIIEHDHPAGAISDETTEHDLTILGATRDPFLGRKLVGSVAQGVGRSAGSSVIVTRKYVTE